MCATVHGFATVYLCVTLGSYHNSMNKLKAPQR